MNSKSEREAKKFLNEKMRKILSEIRADKTKLDRSCVQSKGFEQSDIKHSFWGDGYEFVNDNGCRCYLHFYGYGKIKKRLVRIAIDGVSSNGWFKTVTGLYRCMDEINGIAEEFRKFVGELEKQEKIDDIAKNSIVTWLETVMRNQPYSYYTTTSENKITLSVKMENNLQLDIPIYYSRFQKIMPELLDTIQRFEEIVKKSKIKVLVSNSNLRATQFWRTPNHISRRG
jgi:hypothetical protein